MSDRIAIKNQDLVLNVSHNVNPAVWSEDQKRYRREYYAKRDYRAIICYRAKSRAKRQGIPFDVTVDDVIIPTHCPATGVELRRNVGGRGFSDLSPSLDRIDPHKGYVKGNVQVISARANVIKQNLTPEQLTRFAHWVLGDKK